MFCDPKQILERIAAEKRLQAAVKPAKTWQQLRERSYRSPLTVLTTGGTLYEGVKALCTENTLMMWVDDRPVKLARESVADVDWR